MKRLIQSRLARALSVTLVSTAALYGVTNSTQVNAGIFPGLEAELCMADAFIEFNDLTGLPQDKLNCTANDVEITKIDNESIAECTPGKVVDFLADVTIRTNANERYDTTFYNSLSGQSPQVVQQDVGSIDVPGGSTDYPYYCSLLLPRADQADIFPFNNTDAYADLDSDECADITKANGPDSYTLLQQPIRMLCEDKDGDQQADFTYCAAWDNQSRDNCTDERDPVAGQVPNTKSKCNCDTLNTNIFIKPKPPTIVKELVGTDTHEEPGGDYSFKLSFTNPSTTSSLFISALTDEIDTDGDGIYDKSINLWGPNDTVLPEDDDVYLTANNCIDKAGSPLYEVLPSGTYSCQFTVRIVDSALDEITKKEVYDDVIKVVLEDKNGDPVVNGESCSLAGVPSVDGDHCSDIVTVQVTDVPPVIEVVKFSETEEVPESTPGQPTTEVEYTITVTNNSDWYDDPLTLNTLEDSLYNLPECPPLPTTLSSTVPYTCTFTRDVGGNFGDTVINEASALAVDNETTPAEDDDFHDILVTDVLTNITLVKTVFPLSVPETGDKGIPEEVTYTFTFSVPDTEPDSVTFNTLTDQVIGVDPEAVDITAECFIIGTTTSIFPKTLDPGQSASCEYKVLVTGNDGDERDNVAVIYGVDTDGKPVSASDDATLLFDPVELQVTPEIAMKATVFVKMFNGGVDNVTISAFTIGGQALVDGATVADKYIIRNEAASSEYEPGEGINYEFCAVTSVPEDAIKPDEWYECAFTLQLLPGFDPTAGDISVIAEQLLITVFDNDSPPGGETVANPEITIQTFGEPTPD